MRLRELRDWLDPQGQAFWRQRRTILGWITVLAGAGILYSGHAKLRQLLFPLDWFDLMIHEAGHPVFGLLGSRWLMFAGGTLMQLLMPVLFFFSFLRRSQPKSSDFCMFWFGFNFLGIGPYLADARAQALPLIGGGEHDWAYLLDSVGLLAYDTKIGALAVGLGCFVMAYSAYSLYLHLRKASPALLA